MKKPSEPWYRDGLRFSCHQCGNCCTGEPGYIWVDEKEIHDLARTLKMEVQAFGLKYLKKVRGRYSLIEKPNGDCILWSREKGCTAYAARPRQCRTYPFWPEVVESKKAWAEEARLCRGIAEGLEGQGKKHSQASIKKSIALSIKHDCG